MKTTAALTVLLLSFFLCIPSAHAVVTFDWATVDNPGNAPDTRYDATGFGSVGYTYNVGKHEVTAGQYTEFLNSIASTDTNSLYDEFMESSPLGGITRSGTPGNYKYAVKNPVLGQGPDGTDHTYSNKPVLWVSFLDAMRFVNWLENGQPTGPQDSTTTEDGVYTIIDGVSEIRTPNTKFFIPNQHEWYKAAYFDPISETYYDYPTSTDSTPNNNRPSLDTGNSANFNDGEYTVPLRLTDVGAYTQSASPYGTSDQGGNVWEWIEAASGSFSRTIRGGGWSNSAQDMLASNEGNSQASIGNSIIGFRVASIPEPSTVLLGALAAGGLLMRRNR